MADPIFVGAPVELSVECFDVRTHQAKKPTSLAITVKPPAGPKVTKSWPADPEVVLVSGTVATFAWAYVPEQAGPHAWSAVAAGVLVGVGDGGSFPVRVPSTT